jgi:nicotinamidase-related amidase
MAGSVVVVVDMLEDFFQKGGLGQHRERLVANINELTSFARRCDVPVIWARQEFEPDLSDAFLVMRKLNLSITIAGTMGSWILSELEKDKTDYEIVKKRYSAFFQTGLDELLKKLATNTIIVCGVNTHACVRTTVIDAYQRDYKVILATDGIASYDEEHHRVSVNYLTQAISRGATNREVSQIIENASERA